MNNRCIFMSIILFQNLSKNFGFINKVFYSRSIILQNRLSKTMSTVNPDVHSASSGTDANLLISNLNFVKQKIQATKLKYEIADEITLVAVSKTKPASDILILYEAGQRHFGENYFQELMEKSESEELKNCFDLRWHFIGHLQSQKAAKLIKSVPNLAIIETVDSMKLASKLNNACVASNRQNLNIYIQVDTSNEDTKSGISPDEVAELVSAITKECTHLTIKGLMTIGSPGDLSCFDKLVACRVTVADVLNVPVQSLTLSMGMSGDFEEAISRGATSIRVGSTIFGARDYSKP